MARNHAFFPAKALKIVAVTSNQFLWENCPLFKWNFWTVCACMWMGMAYFLVYLSKERGVEDKATNVYPTSQ